MVLDRLEHPIVQAPMGGGASTPALAAAVAEAGGLGFLAAGYKTPDAVRSDIEALRALTSRPFGLNLFAPPAGPADRAAVAAFGATLRAESERAGVELGEPRHDDDGWEPKLALAESERVPLVTFTFGSPSAAVVERMHAAGAEVWVTVTSPAEARIARDAGADALVVQGVEAPPASGACTIGSSVRSRIDMVPRVLQGLLLVTGGAALMIARSRIRNSASTCPRRTPPRPSPCAVTSISRPSEHSATSSPARSTARARSCSTCAR